MFFDFSSCHFINYLFIFRYFLFSICHWSDLIPFQHRLLSLSRSDSSSPVLFPAEITAPTLWIKQLVYKENRQNSSTSRKQGAKHNIVVRFENKQTKTFQRKFWAGLGLNSRRASALEFFGPPARWVASTLLQSHCVCVCLCPLFSVIATPATDPTCLPRLLRLPLC